MGSHGHTRVVVAMSGGVDSSVAAALLREQGYDVIGVTLRLYACGTTPNERGCCGLAGVSEARATAGHLGIPHYVIDGEAEFDERVLRPAWEDYAAGRTPNPCVRCNEWLKFGSLCEHARALGATHVATGHHARVHCDGSRHRLLRGRDPGKDQSYFLFSLRPEQLAMALFPVGELTKADVRAIARQGGLPNAERRESQDACIAQRGDLAEALRHRFGAESRPGVLRDLSGKILGRHDGIHRFTIGQRKGLGVARGRRAYVVAIDAETGDVMLGEPSDLATRVVTVSGANWLEEVPIGEPLACEAQIRYRHRAVSATLTRGPGDSATATLAPPQHAVTPGQATVFYQGERVLGGGWIVARTSVAADSAG